MRTAKAEAEQLIAQMMAATCPLKSIKCHLTTPIAKANGILSTRLD